MTVAAKFAKPLYVEPAGSTSLILPFAKVGIEVEVEGYDGSRMPATMADKWESHEDHSLRRGREFTSRGGLVGKEIVTSVRAITDYCKEKAFNVGYPRAGIHLHIDMTDMNDGSNTQLLHMFMAYMLFEDAVFHFAGDWRKGCGFCEPWLISQTGLGPLSKLLLNWEKYPASTIGNLEKYQAVNFLPLFQYGTVEFRHLPTTFDDERILNWINICLAFKHWGQKVDRDPVAVLDVEGVETLARGVFGEWYPVIAPYINAEEVQRAALDVIGMRVINGKHTIGTSWDAPSNTLLALKKKAAAARPVQIPDANGPVIEVQRTLERDALETIFAARPRRPAIVRPLRDTQDL